MGMLRHSSSTLWFVWVETTGMLIFQQSEAWTGQKFQHAFFHTAFYFDPEVLVWALNFSVLVSLPLHCSVTATTYWNPSWKHWYQTCKDLNFLLDLHILKYPASNYIFYHVRQKVKNPSFFNSWSFCFLSLFHFSKKWKFLALINISIMKLTHSFQIMPIFGTIQFFLLKFILFLSAWEMWVGSSKSFFLGLEGNFPPRN